MCLRDKPQSIRTAHQTFHVELVKQTGQRCLAGLGISVASLHSYRYAWAEHALKCGFPERFAQQALGHNSKAVHRAYAKHAEAVQFSLWRTHNPNGGRIDMESEQPSLLI